MKRSPSLAALLGHTALVALLLPGAALAQDTTDLETITVEGAGEGTGATGPVGAAANPATGTGAKTAARITEIPQSVSVIGAEVLDRTNANKIDSVLAYSAGVQAAPYGYDSDTNWFFVRGFAGTATGAFVDGLPSYSYGFGGFYIDPAGLERVEVLRGPASALYGAANPGGLVNMVSKRPGGEPGGSYQLGVDSTGRGWVGTDAQGTTAGGLDWRLVGRVERTDDLGVFEPGSRLFLAPSLSYTLDSGTKVTLGATVNTINEDHVGGSWLPYVGTVEAAPFGFIARDFNSSEPAYDWYKRKQVTVSAEISHAFDNGWTLTNNSRLGLSNVDESSVYAYGYAGFSATPTDPANTLSRIFFQHQTETRVALNDLRAEREFTLGGAQHKLMFGLDAKWFRMDQVQGSVAWPGAATGLSANNPVYGAAQPATTPYLDNIVTQTQLGLYAQDQIRWGDGWIGTLNLRHDLARTEVSDDRSTGAAGSTRSDGMTTWRVALAKEFDNGLTAYGSASSYFNPQVITSAAGNGVGPETGDQREVGVKWAPSDTTLFTLSLFDISRQNISQSVWNGAGYDYFQIGEVSSQGIELEGKHDFGNGLRLTASATAMDVNIDSDVDTTIIGKTPMSTVEKMASVKVDYTPAAMPALTLSGGVRFMGSSYADNLNTLEVPAVTLLDAGASYEMGNGWTGNLAISNLADTTYVAACQTGFSCFYGEERRISLSLSREF